MKDIEKQILQQIESTGIASELELQAEQLLPLQTLADNLKSLQDKGLVRKKKLALGKLGDGYELTPKGYKQLGNSC